VNAPDRAVWLAERRTGIGGSDIAALLGLSPYKTQVELWLDKTGRAPDIEPDADQAERMHWGNVLEDVVARHYAALRDVKIQRINTMLRHPAYPAALANIDRAIVTEGSRARWDDGAGRVLGADRVLEVKTAHAMAQGSAEWGEPGTDEVPQHYWMQCQWYLAITGLPFADLAVLFGGQKFCEYTIPADAGLQGDLLAQAQGWWQRHVVEDMPPDPTTEADARTLWRAHKAGVEKIVDTDVAQAVAELQRIKAQIGNEKTEGTLEYRMQQLRDVICAAFGEAEAITHAGRKLATWKANKPSVRTDWKAVAAALEPVPELVAEHTTETPGARVLRLSAAKE
jgi:putative phage-type endonuclease